MQQQQHASYDLLAVFTDEEHADAAASKLHKEGFADDEVYQLEAGLVGAGQFRVHGPNATRGDYFLQTRRARANPLMVVLFAIIAGLVLGGLTFGAATFAFPKLPEPTTIIVGVVLGIILGAISTMARGGRVRGNIGQTRVVESNNSKTITAPKSARTVVALRFPDPDNISRKSRARAILLNNGGKIDRSVTRQE